MSGPDGVAATALKGARLALAQLAVDAEDLLKRWHEKERALWEVQTREARTEAATLAQCRRDVEALLRLWQID